MANILNYVGGAIVYILPLLQVASILLTGEPSYVASFSFNAFLTQLVLMHVLLPIGNLIYMARQYYKRKGHRIFDSPSQELRKHFKYDWQSFLFNSSLQGRWATGMLRHLFSIPTRFGSTPVGKMERLPFWQLFRQIVKDNRHQFQLAGGILMILAWASLRLPPGTVIAVFLPGFILYASHILTPFILNPLFMRKLNPFPKNRQSA